MKNILTVLLFAVSLAASAQNLSFESAKFHFGDDPQWKNPGFDDSSWQEMRTTVRWDEQGFAGRTEEFGWYRIHFNPAQLLEASDFKNALRIYCGRIDDADETYLNGHRIGGMGILPETGQGDADAWEKDRLYIVDLTDGYVNRNGDNVLAIRVWNASDDGGMYNGPVTIAVPSKCDAIDYSFKEECTDSGKKVVLTVRNLLNEKQKGTLTLKVCNPETGEVFDASTKEITLGRKQAKALSAALPENGYCRAKVKYVDSKSGIERNYKFTPKYILTPEEPEAPRFNGAMLFGVRPGSPIIYRIPVSGKRPMKITAENLPEGVRLNSENCCISGNLQSRGDYRIQLHAENAEGSADTELTIRVGDRIALTPPMGWNSWNCWGLSVSQEKVISSALAILNMGLADYGYNYINIDDAWEAPERNADGTIATNEKFPAMKELGNWLHSRGLRMGIYSSPGIHTCGKYLGSLDHELQDARTYSEWGVDYLKYDWCGYGKKHENEIDNKTVASYVRPYLLMGEYLRQQPRDIFYSLCQYGMMEVWKWGYAVDANSWRTTGDITDTWESLEEIGFKEQRDLYPYGQPNHWNDPDMMIVGKVGWSSNLRDSRLTVDEQYTHVSLWALLAANMLIGCDVAQMDHFTRQLLCNNEVNAINQDILGHQAKPIVTDGQIEVWARDLNDGTVAFGIFNRGAEDAIVDISNFVEMAFTKGKTLRNLWTQQDLPEGTAKFFIPSHGVKLIKVK